MANLDLTKIIKGNDTYIIKDATAQSSLTNKQDTLVSGTNIKTINNSSILGEGNLSIDSLPSQSGNNGKFLTTNGTNSSWATITFPTVDQIYDGTSTNAQSGVAIASIIPTVNNATLTITQGGVSKGTFTANSGIDTTIALDAGSDIDNSTITKNSSNKLQTVSILNKNTISGATNPLNLWEGSEYQYNTGGGNITWYNWLYTSSSLSFSTAGYISGCTLFDVIYANNKFVAVGSYTCAYSTDGENWTETTSSLNADYKAVTFGNNRYVAVGQNSCIYSSDGQNWTSATIPNNNYKDIVYGNGKFVAITDGGYSYCSTNGEVWSEGYTISDDSYSAITYANNKFVAVGSYTCAYSTDGENWTKPINVPDDTFCGITYGNGKFVALNEYGYSYCSTDGEVWEGYPISDDSYLAITYGSGIFVAIGDSVVAYSTDGENWTRLTNSPQGTFHGITYGNGKFVIVGEECTSYANYTSSSVFTNTNTPTTSSQVYSAPNIPSALTITSVGTGTITLNNTLTYVYNSGGNQTISLSVGDAHPDWLCLIEGIGIKKGYTFIATANVPET